MTVGCKGVFREKDGEQDCAREGVDYVVVIGTSVRKGSAKREFDIQVLGGAEKTSNREITRDRSNGALKLLQMLKMFNMVEARFAITPLASHFKSFPRRCPRLRRGNEMSRVPYASAVGPPRYAMVCN